MLNSLIIAFLYQEIAIIDKAMPAAGYAYANLGKQIKNRGISYSFNFRISLIALTSTIEIFIYLSKSAANVISGILLLRIVEN